MKPMRAERTPSKRVSAAGKEIPKAPKMDRLRAVLPEVWELMRPRRGLLGLGFLLMLVNRVSSLVLPYSTKFLIDIVINQHQINKLRPLVLVVLAATLLQGITSFSLTQLLSKAAQRLIAADAPYVSLWDKTNVIVAAADQKGIELSPTADFSFLARVSR